VICDRNAIRSHRPHARALLIFAYPVDQNLCGMPLPRIGQYRGGQSRVHFRQVDVPAINVP
jgi:hypothetical protein